MVYDYIIVGAGMGGISAGINLAINNKKVLILEKNSLPGGLVSTFKKGRFEFDTSGYDIYNYGDKEHIGELQKILSKYKVNIETDIVPFNYIVKEEKKDTFKVKGSFEEFIVDLEDIKFGSAMQATTLAKITKEIRWAMDIILKGDIPKEEDYPRFYKYLDYMASDALLEIGFSKEVIKRLSIWWLDVGSPLNKLSFIDFCLFLEKLIFKKNAIFDTKNLDFCLKLIKRYQKVGGKINYNSWVVNIDMEDNIKLVETKDGHSYKAKHVICDVSRRLVFKDLIKKEIKDVNRLENARTIGANGVVIYLGLNKNYQDLGLEYYKYYKFTTLDSTNNIKYMNSLGHNTWIAYVPNVVNNNASPKNTTILVLKQIYFSDVFNNVAINEYEKLKNDIADSLISDFEETYKIDIREYIEEIAISTPFTVERLTSNVNGTMYGYMLKGYDNAIHRILSYEDEEIEGLSFVGASSIFGSGIDNAIISGFYITNKLLGRK